MMYVCDNLPFSDEFPDHTDSDTASEHLEYCVTSRENFTAVAHGISQITGRVGHDTEFVHAFAWAIRQASSRAR